MTTLNKIAEQIKLLAYGHYQGGQGPHLEEVKLLVGQCLATLFKTEKVSQIAGMGDFNPDALMIATYDERPVEEYKDRSKIKLPVYPMSLPMGMGVWYVAPSDDIDNFFVPLISGQAGLTKSVKLLNKYENRIAYEVNGDEIITTRAIHTGPDAITKVLVRELVTDVSGLGEYDPLPIPPDMEQPVIEMALRLLGVRQPTEARNEPKEHG